MMRGAGMQGGEGLDMRHLMGGAQHEGRDWIGEELDLRE